MGTSTHTGAASTRARGGALVLARAVLLVAGGVTLAAAVYFTFFASAEDGGVSTTGDWVVAVAALVLALAYLGAAFGLGARPTARAVAWTAVLVVAHVVFGLVKLIGYGESESLPFFVADLIILSALAVWRRQR